MISDKKHIPVAIQRLLDEVAASAEPIGNYNRIHNRHNRSMSLAPESSPPKDSTTTVADIADKSTDKE